MLKSKKCIKDVNKLKGNLYYSDDEGQWTLYGIEYDKINKSLTCNEFSGYDIKMISKMDLFDYILLMDVINENLENGRCGGCS